MIGGRRSRFRCHGCTTEPGELPARPDPRTGQPRPAQHPPTRAGTCRPARPPSRTRPTRAPPPGQTPVLPGTGQVAPTRSIAAGRVGVRRSRRGVHLTLGLSWVSTWVMWPIIALCLIGIYASTRVSQCRVGADWVANRKTLGEDLRVGECDLPQRSGDPELRLIDSDGRRTTLGIPPAERSDIWDLTYNGILHCGRSATVAAAMQHHGELTCCWPARRPALATAVKYAVVGQIPDVPIVLQGGIPSVVRRPSESIRRSSGSPTPLWQVTVHQLVGLTQVFRLATQSRRPHWLTEWTHRSRSGTTDDGPHHPVSPS